MSATPIGHREHPALMSHDTARTLTFACLSRYTLTLLLDQSSSPLVQRRDAIGRNNELPYTISSRLPTDVRRTAARARAIRPGAESTLPSGLAYPRPASPVNSPVSRASPGDASDDDFDAPRSGAIGPVRSVKSHSRRQPPGHIPRPRNAFILYRSWYVRQGFLADVEVSV
jgi:hypothetical protein